MDLGSKHFLVVGASGALGQRIVRRLRDAGASVSLAGRDAGRLAEVGGADAHVLTGDLIDPTVPGRFVAEAAEHAGRLDGVVIASGVVAFGPAAEVDDDTVDDLLLVNLIAPLRLVRAALGAVEEGGVVVNLGAVVAEKPVGGMAAYSASKAGIGAFLAATRPEARRRKIRIVDVRPPHTETGLATRPVAGEAPRMPEGLDPDVVADRIVAAITGDETDVPSTEFG
ncbi:SDR family NAD(P)-dependent oxidoreductase [Rhodococcoides kroppenstedtii]|uniref:SDR family NAD(P)-dependent oxidoreductase n=1 Tax=Rhodococcoides kroppenstedtii TaxID=293050 RepID=UPI00363C635C